MSTHYHISVEANFVLQIYTGSVTGEDIWTLNEKMMGDPAFHRLINGIVDFSQARMLVGFLDVERLCRQFELSGNYSRGRWALIPGDHLGFGLSRIYQSMASDLHEAIEIFDTVEDARRWILSETPVKVQGTASGLDLPLQALRSTGS